MFIKNLTLLGFTEKFDFQEGGGGGEGHEKRKIQGTCLKGGSLDSLHI